MKLADIVNEISAFDKSPSREKIRLFAWYVHTFKNKEVFSNADIRECFSNLHIADPNVAKYLSRMVVYKDVMKVRGGFKLERAVRQELDKKYGVHHTVVQVSKLLADLPAKLASVAEKIFLEEAIKCYRVEAFRACVVMTWNLGYSHLLYWILKDGKRLDNFNVAIGKRYPKKPPVKIAIYDDFFEELKESEVIEICKTANLVSSNVIKILREKLGKRNTAAHPASVVIVQSQADDVVTDLVNNVVLALT